MTRALGVFVAATLVFASGSAAQSPLTVEVRAGLAVPQGSLSTSGEGGAALAAGNAFGVRFDLEQGWDLGLMLGFSQYRVSCETSTCPSDEQWVSTQWELGLRWKPSGGRLRPWVSLATIFPKVERDRGRLTEISSTDVGFELGFGGYVQIRDRWYLSPGVRWATWDSDFGPQGQIPIHFLTVDLGLLIAF